MISGILKKYYNYTILILLLIFSAFPVLPRAAESIIIILLSSFSLIYFLFEGKKNWNRSKTIVFFGLSIFFWVYLFTLLYSNNLSYGLNTIKIMLPIVLFPLIFSINKENLFQSKSINQFIYVYILSLFFYLVYINFFVFKALFIKDLNFIQLRYLFEKFTGVHGTYFSIWIGFGVFLILFLVQQNKKNKYFFWGALPILLYFFYWQNTLAARMPFIATLLLLIVYLFKGSKKLLFITAILLIGGFFALSQFFFYKERLDRIIKYDFTFPKGEYSTNWPNISPEHIRNGIYYCSYLKIKESPLLGYGIGDADDQLQDCYDCQFTETDTYKILKYNSHNQYLDIILASGLLGFLILTFFQFKMIKIAIKNKNSIYLFFLFYFILDICFENVLHRQDGVMFFSFFNSILFFQLSNKK